MMKIWKVIFALISLSALLTGCASGPKMSEIKPSIPAVSQGNGRVFFYRKSVLFGDGLRPKVMLNGEMVGKAVPDGFFFLDLPGGNYEVGTSTEVERKLSMELAPGEHKYVRFAIQAGILVGRVQPELIDKAQATADMEDMHYIGKPLK
jgi:hypothetical protein